MRIKRFLTPLAVVVFVLAVSASAHDIPGTAKSIKAGKTNVGKVTGMELDKRFHNIHNKVLGLECTSCHISSFAPDYAYQKKYKDVGGMGHVDRGICLGCHKENGPAQTKLYGTAER